MLLFAPMTCTFHPPKRSDVEANSLARTVVCHRTRGMHGSLGFKSTFPQTMIDIDKFEFITSLTEIRTPIGIVDKFTNKYIYKLTKI